MKGKGKEQSKGLKVLAVIGSILFGLVLIWVLWLKFGNADSILFNYGQLLELTAKERFLLDIEPFVRKPYHGENYWLEIALNGFVLAPFGVTFNVIDKKRRVWLHVLICFLFSLGIETLQFFTMIGGFATADLIMNTLSYFVGLIMYHLIFRWLLTKVNIVICVLFICVLCVALVFAVASVVEIKDTLAMILCK